MFHEGQQYAEGRHYPWTLGVAIADRPEGPWVEYKVNPMVNVGKDDDWDGVAIYNGSVVNVGDRWYMWYSGFGKHPDQFGLIGLATASSPLGPWTKYPENPVLSHGSPGSWNGFGLQEPYVLFYDGLFHMWVSGNADESRPMQAAIGYFWSKDGIRWEGHPNNPVLPTGRPGGWDYPNVSEPFVYIEGDTIYLFYEGFSGPDEFPADLQQDIAIISSAIGLATAKMC